MRWLKWLWRRPRTVAVTLYTRAGCHLCEEAHTLLTQAGQRYSLALQILDIDTDPTLAAEHGLHVPVVVVEGTVRFRGVVNRVLLERLLRALS